MDKIAILLNPSSGGGKSGKRKEQIGRIFSNFGIPHDLLVTFSEENLRELSAEAVRKNQTIVAVGGDTTFNIVATQILENKSLASPKLGMIGTGSANDVCRSLGIGHIQTLCRAMVHQQVKRMDVGHLQIDGKKSNRYFLGSMSAGLGTAVNRHIAKFSQKHPYLSKYTGVAQGLAGIRGVFRAFNRKVVPRSITISADGHSESVSFSLLVFLNTGFYANGLELIPGSSAFDGQLDCAIVHTNSAFQTLRFQKAVKKRKHLDTGEFQRLRSRCFNLEPGTGMDFQLDGEIIRDVGRCRVSILPQALEVFVPISPDTQKPNRTPGTPFQIRSLEMMASVISWVEAAPCSSTSGDPVSLSMS